MRLCLGGEAAAGGWAGSLCPPPVSAPFQAFPGSLWFLALQWLFLWGERFSVESLCGWWLAVNSIFLRDSVLAQQQKVGAFWVNAVIPY